MWTRSELKEKAKLNVRESYWGLVLMSLILGFFTGGSSGGSSGGNAGNSISEIANSNSDVDPGIIIGIVVGALVIMLICLAIGFAFSAFLAGPGEVGAMRYFIDATYAPQTVNDMRVLGMAFKSGIYMNVVKVMFFKYLYTWLWSLLFVIPGIIKGYEYRMIPYILAENPNIDKDEAFALSKQMMDGDKMNAFVLDLSFIGWGILSVFTCGILATFYVAPYMNMTKAHLYIALRTKTPGFLGMCQQPNMYGQQMNAQQPSGYDTYGQPVYGQQMNMQQSYGYDQNANQNSGFGFDQNANQNNGFGFDQNANQNNGFGFDQNANQNNGLGFDQNANQNNGFGFDQNANQNSGFGFDQNANQNNGFGFDQNANQNNNSGTDSNGNGNTNW